MAKLLAFDWDQREARFVVARPKGDSLAIDQVVAVPLELSAQQGNYDELAEQLKSALTRANLPKCQVLTSVGRSLIELDRLQLPPAPEEELPEMVRFQAMRQFASLQENSPLDFVPLGASGNESGEIIAAAIPKDLADQVQSALTAQGQEPSRVGMRACAVASLAMRRQPKTRQGVALIIAQQSESAELVVTKDGLVVFTRSFRLPNDWIPSESGEPMLGEVRRTIAAAQNQLGSSRVERIVLFGTAQHAELCERIAARTKLDVELQAPFADVQVQELPERPERFAAAIGMLLDEANQVPPVIDFFNPRQAPEPESPTRKRVFYGGVLAAAALALIAMVMWKYRSLDLELKQRTRTFAKISKENEELESTVALASELREWKQADRNWLDEMVHLSEVEGLTADDFMLDSFIGRTLRDNTGFIEVQGKSKTLAARQKLQMGWQDEQHQVSPDLSSPIKNKKDDRYPNMFKASIKTSVSIPISQEPLAPPSVAMDVGATPGEMDGDVGVGSLQEESEQGGEDLDAAADAEATETKTPEIEATETAQKTSADRDDQEAA